MTCSHPSGEITDHTVQEVLGQNVRYAWRGSCLSCQRGVVGVTALPFGLPSERLKLLLTDELMAYFGQVSALRV